MITLFRVNEQCKAYKIETPKKLIAIAHFYDFITCKKRREYIFFSIITQFRNNRVVKKWFFISQAVNTTRVLGLRRNTYNIRTCSCFKDIGMFLIKSFHNLHTSHCRVCWSHADSVRVGSFKHIINCFMFLPFWFHHDGFLHRTALDN